MSDSLRKLRARALQMHWLDYSDNEIAEHLSELSASIITAEVAREMRLQAYGEQRAD